MLSKRWSWQRVVPVNSLRHVASLGLREDKSGALAGLKLPFGRTLKATLGSPIQASLLPGSSTTFPQGSLCKNKDWKSCTSLKGEACGNAPFCSQRGCCVAATHGCLCSPVGWPSRGRLCHYSWLKGTKSNCQAIWFLFTSPRSTTAPGTTSSQQQQQRVCPRQGSRPNDTYFLTFHNVGQLHMGI